jgi:glycosyltransferase involved in cell wall biosynthesis
MKILFVDQTGQLGGGELSLLDLIMHSGFESEVALFADGPFRVALEQAGIPVHLILGGSVDKVRRETGAASLLRAGPALLNLKSRLSHLASDFDVIYANSQKAFLVSSLVKRRDQLLVWHLRDMLTADHFGPALRRAAVAAGNMMASVVIANSHATADSFVKAGGRHDKVFVVYNGIDCATFDAVSDLIARSARNDLQLDDKFLVGSFGRLSPWKGQHILLEAISSIPDVHAVLIGEALFGEDAYVETLRARARESDLEGRIQFLGFRADVPTLMKSVDVVVHTSTSPEPFGRVIVEGMLANRPVIATRAGGALEIIKSGETGILVQPGSAAELSSAIRELRSNPQFARKMAAAGKREAMASFSVNAMVKGVRDIVEQHLI